MATVSNLWNTLISYLSKNNNTSTTLLNTLITQNGSSTITFGGELKASTPASTTNDTTVATTEYVQNKMLQKTTENIAATSDGQSIFTTSGYTDSKIDVYLSGVYLVPSKDYSMPDGQNVVLSTVMAATVLTGNYLSVISYSTFAVADAMTSQEVSSALSTYLPLSDGTAQGLSIEKSTSNANALYVEPGNTVDMSGTGNVVMVPTPTVTDSSTNVATTEYVHNYLPVGTVVLWITNTIPSGWLLLDGSTFDQTECPTLYSLLGSTTLPDMRGLFARGYDPKGTYDNDGTKRGLLSFQYASTLYGGAGTNSGNIANFGENNQTLENLQWDKSYPYTNSNVPWQSYSGATINQPAVSQFGAARPYNMAFNYIIKAV